MFPEQGYPWASSRLEGFGAEKSPGGGGVAFMGESEMEVRNGDLS